MGVSKSAARSWFRPRRCALSSTYGRLASGGARNILCVGCFARLPFCCPPFPSPRKAAAQVRSGETNRVIWMCWTGNNAVPSHLRLCLRTIQRNAGLPVILVTPSNVLRFVPDLHPAYEFLHLQHRADYLAGSPGRYPMGPFKPNTGLTRKWLEALRAKLDQALPVFQARQGYPFYWQEILRDIFVPASLVHRDKVARADVVGDRVAQLSRACLSTGGIFQTKKG
ncbi:unnamed protein product [Prorocentrum cordatum]|uniref:Uncharacterized protein n=1 Tax=Prorocentrum cordatum TaxID=2364126 RepID=A0ABN9SLD2_9DINO|nr:unnamed protein product [Polarella glacialis]